MVLMALLTALPAPARAADPGGTLGVYAGSGKPEAVAAFESRLGRPLKQVHDFQPKDSWSSLTDMRWSLQRWTTSPYARRVTYSIPMLPDSGGTLAEGATGAFNEQFRNLAVALVAAGEGSATLRLGWEFNGNWFRWSIGVPNGPADYAAYWRQIVTTMRSVPGASFKFDWCPNNGSSWVDGKQLDAAGAYPGDAYVDYIGMDVYDQSWSSQRNDPAARFNEFLTRKDGMNWQRDFASAHGKPISFPEWGVGHRKDGYGGGDEPAFIERMHDWIKANRVAYHNYFEFADSILDAALFGGRSPKAAQRFVELFGPSAAGSSAGTSGAQGSAGAAGSPPPAGSAGADGDEGGSAPTKMSISRARIVRESRSLDLLAPITRLASGSAEVELYAGGARTRFAATIDSARGQVRVKRQITRRQASRRTGIVTISYGGNARTLPQQVRLRAAPRPAQLTARRPTIRGSRLAASGTIGRAASGVVRLELVYDVDGRSVTRKFSTRIRDGRWSLAASLSKAVRDEMARRSGSVHSYTLYTGYGPAMIGGEMKSYQVLGAV